MWGWGGWHGGEVGARWRWWGEGESGRRGEFSMVRATCPVSFLPVTRFHTATRSSSTGTSSNGHSRGRFLAASVTLACFCGVHDCPRASRAARSSAWVQGSRVLGADSAGGAGLFMGGATMVARNGAGGSSRTGTDISGKSTGKSGSGMGTHPACMLLPPVAL